MPRARHRSAARTSRSAPAGAVIGAAVVGLAIVAGSVVLIQRGNASPSCSGTVGLDVDAAPSLTAPLTRVAATFNAAKHTTAAGRCVVVKISSKASADAAAALGQGWPDTAGPVPDVWMPESTDWLNLTRTQSAAARILPTTAPTVASSPVVIAMPRPMAQALGWPAKQLSWAQLAADENSASVWSKAGHRDWGTFTVGYPDPSTSLTGLQTVLATTAASQRDPVSDVSAVAFQQDRAVQLGVLSLERGAATIPATDEALAAALRSADSKGKALSFLSAVPMRESDVVAYNRGVGAPGGQPPKVPLAASYPADGTFADAVPYAVLRNAAADPATDQAAAEFLAQLRGAEGQAQLTAAGLRTPTGASTGLSSSLGVQPTLAKQTPATVDGATLVAGQSIFHSVHQRGSTLAVLDGSGSMNEMVPGSPPQTKIQIAIQACLQGVELFAPNDRVGLWEFSTGLPGGTGYEQLSPVVPLDSKGRYGTHKDDLIQLKDTPVPGGDTPLYQVALAAFRYQNTHYLPGRLNEVVLLTDGNNDNPENPHDITLANLVKTLKKEYKPDRPVHVITIAFGTDADRTALQQVSQATDAHSYQSANPRDILNVFINAVLQAASST